MGFPYGQGNAHMPKARALTWMSAVLLHKCDVNFIKCDESFIQCGESFEPWASKVGLQA